MTAGLGLSAYIDVPRFLRTPTGQETTSLLGMNTTLAGSGNTVGATSVQLAASAGWAPGAAWVLDGPLSEVVSVTGSADGTHVTIAAPGLQLAHAAGVSLSQAGTGGSLAETILAASAWIENYCQQGASGSDRSLFAVTRSERWAMPTVRAHIDRDNVLLVMPGHFPVQSLASVSVEFGQGQSISLDATQLELQVTGRFIEIPFLMLGGPTVGQQLLLQTKGLSRSQRQWAVVSYVGGIALSPVPYEVQQACVWATADFLSYRQNPTGAAELVLGKRNIIQRQRGDLVGDSILLLRAHDALEPYRAEAWA